MLLPGLPKPSHFLREQKTNMEIMLMADVNLADMGDNLATKLGINDIAGGILCTFLFLIPFLLPALFFGKKGVIGGIFIGFMGVGMGVAIGWLDVWFILVLLLFVAISYTSMWTKLG